MNLLTEELKAGWLTQSKDNAQEFGFDRHRALWLKKVLALVEFHLKLPGISALV
jgi:hypothetical protein